MAILEERVISGKGTLRLPPNDDLRKSRIVTLYALVLRPPTSKYENLKFNPPRSYYATLQFLRGGYVQFTATMEFFTQMWDFYVDPAFAPIYALQCSEAALRLGLADIGSSAPASSIEEWRHTNTLWDEIKVVCFSDTAIALQVVSTEWDVCVPLDEEDPPKDPPPPPPAPDPEDPPVPPGQPLGDGNDFFPSPPYDEEDSDGGDTSPFPGDSYEPEPPPEEPDGGQARVDFTYVIVGSPGANSRSVTFWSPVYEVFIEAGKVKARAHGLAGFGAASPTPVVTTLEPPDPFSATDLSYTITQL